MSTARSAGRWQDWASFILGLWLAVSPWLAGYSSHEAATANAAFVGLTLALATHFEVSFDEVTMEWLNLAGGVWLILAPFLLGFDGLHVAAVNSIAVGGFIAVLSASALELDRELGRLWNSASQGIRR